MKFKFMKRLLAADDGAGTGTEGTEGAEDTGTENTDTSGSDDSNQDPPAKTFTQKEVNSLMKNEKESGKKALLKELGLEDVKSAKDGLAKYKEYLESQKSESEKTAEALKAAQDLANNAKLELTKTNAKLTALTLSVKNEALDDVINIALSKVTETNDLETVIKDMKTKEVYSGFFTEGNNTNSDSSKGTGSGIGSKNSFSDKNSIAARITSANKSTQSKSSYFSR